MPDDRRRNATFSLILILLALLGGGAPLCAQVNAGQATAPGSGAGSAASIHGVVTSKDGELYQGVRVTLAADAQHATAERAVTTDSDGVFNFAGVLAGAFKLTFWANGFGLKTVEGKLDPGQSYDAQTVVLPVTLTTNVVVRAPQADIALEQVNLEEKQRVLGVIPNYYVTYVPDAPPLTARQKYGMAWKTSIDPVTWLVTGAIAGVQQADNTFSGYGQGAQGYAKRYAANYADQFIGAFLGGAVLPVAFKQDPRYFYKGTGTVRSRILYAIEAAVICKGDNGHSQFDYSGILGSLAAGGISNLYYPAANRDDVGLMFEETGYGIAGSAVGNLFQEFVVRKLTPRVPHYEPSGK